MNQARTKVSVAMNGNRGSGFALAKPVVAAGDAQNLPPVSFEDFDYLSSVHKFTVYQN
jgi:hypothetical protein